MAALVASAEESMSGAMIANVCSRFLISCRFEVFCLTGGVGGQHDVLFLLRPPSSGFEEEEDGTVSHFCHGESDGGNEMLFRKYLPGGDFGNESSRAGIFEVAWALSRCRRCRCSFGFKPILVSDFVRFSGDLHGSTSSFPSVTLDDVSHRRDLCGMLSFVNGKGDIDIISLLIDKLVAKVKSNGILALSTTIATLLASMDLSHNSADKAKSSGEHRLSSVGVAIFRISQRWD